MSDHDLVGQGPSLPWRRLPVLYACDGTHRRPSWHSCGKAHRALVSAAIDHDVVVAATRGRWAGHRDAFGSSTSSQVLPTLVLPDGSGLTGAAQIGRWAKDTVAEAAQIQSWTINE